jgi:hypothetical protein
VSVEQRKNVLALVPTELLVRVESAIEGLAEEERLAVRRRIVESSTAEEAEAFIAERLGPHHGVIR